jgi:hypothetical protein
LRCTFENLRSVVESTRDVSRRAAGRGIQGQRPRQHDPLFVRLTDAALLGDDRIRLVGQAQRETLSRRW